MARLSHFFRSRINSGAWAVLVLALIEILNNWLSTNLTVQIVPPGAGPLPGRQIYLYLHGLVLLLLAAAILFWLLDNRHRLHVTISISNSVFTAQLFAATVLLVVRLAQSAHVTVTILIRDACLIFITNILIFALWYWLIDSARAGFFVTADESAWDFLFPQRQADYPGHAAWRPSFFDYVFLAFTTSVAFSPTDTAPLTRAAKFLMMTEATIALIAITVVAGTAINILAGNA